jgi:predicted TIM-barrel fold metal-dependent hydrolase
MGRIPLQDPKSADLLPKWKEQQGMAGIRVTFNNAQTIPWLTDGTANWFWPAAEKAGLPVMCFAPGRVSLLGPIVERHPQLALILDHMGLTAAMLKDNRVEDAIGQAVALAKYPNVSVKLSASPGISREPYPFRDVAGHLKRVFDAYGPQRSYWGTDLTNTYAKGSYRQRIHPFHRRAELPLRKRQGLGDGPRDRAVPAVDVNGRALRGPPHHLSHWRGTYIFLPPPCRACAPG